MFLKEKWSEVIKGRGCVDGRPQHLYIAHHTLGVNPLNCCY